MLTMIYFLWGNKYTSHHVNVLKRAIDKNLSIPHRHLCITDDFSRELDKDIILYPLWKDLFDCPYHLYRLKLFHKDYVIFGNRIVNIDIDCVVTGKLDDLFDTDAKFKIWSEDWRKECPHCGTFWMMKTGEFPWVWDNLINNFDKMKKKIHPLKDQNYLYYCFPNAERWTQEDGIYNYRTVFKKEGRDGLKENAKLVFFNGRYDPLDNGMIKKHSWIKGGLL